MIFLENSQKVVLSRGIRNLSPIKFDGIKVKNRLLDGTYHIQTIGDSMRYIEFEILSNHDQVNLINIAEDRGESLKLIIDGEFFIGLLNKELDWQRITMRYRESKNRFYTAKIRLNLHEEGIA